MAQKTPTSRSALRAIFAITLIGFLLGCDGFDPTALLPKKSDATSQEGAEASRFAGSDRVDSVGSLTGSSQKREAREPHMESIGPDQSQRVYYQFVDDRGRVQFVERLGDVPDAWRDRVGYVEMSQPPPLTPLEARRTWKLSADRTAEILLASGPSTSTARRGSSAEVVLYSADWCGYCTKARAHLDRNGVDYEVRDVDIDSIAQELRAKTGRGGVPVLDFNGEILRGYSSQQYDRVIQSIQRG